MASAHTIRNRRNGTGDRGNKIRRDSDRVFQKIAEVLWSLERISRGEDVDFTEAFRDLVGLKDKIGRRKGDHRFAESLCAAIEALANNLGHPLRAKEQPLEVQPRKIRLTKISGKNGIERSIVGWEDKPPILGKRYKLFREDGGIFRSSSVSKIAAGYIQTEHSLYKIVVLDRQK